MFKSALYFNKWGEVHILTYFSFKILIPVLLNFQVLDTTLLKIVKGIKNVFYCPNKACLNSFIKPSLWFWSLDSYLNHLYSGQYVAFFFIKRDNSNLYRNNTNLCLTLSLFCKQFLFNFISLLLPVDIFVELKINV